MYAFTHFADLVLEVFKQANFTPECSIAIGLVGLLLIQVCQPSSWEWIPLTSIVLRPLNYKSETEERLELEIGQLADIIS